MKNGKADPDRVPDEHTYWYKRGYADGRAGEKSDTDHLTDNDRRLYDLGYGAGKTDHFVDEGFDAEKTRDDAEAWLRENLAYELAICEKGGMPPLMIQAWSEGLARAATKFAEQVKSGKLVQEPS